MYTIFFFFACLCKTLHHDARVIWVVAKVLLCIYQSCYHGCLRWLLGDQFKRASTVHQEKIITLVTKKSNSTPLLNKQNDWR